MGINFFCAYAAAMFHSHFQSDLYIEIRKFSSYPSLAECDRLAALVWEIGSTDQLAWGFAWRFGYQAIGFPGRTPCHYVCPICLGNLDVRCV